LYNGPGVFVTTGLVRNKTLIEKTNAAYAAIIKQEKGKTSGDHFAAGNNDRIWNSFSKHALADPVTFVQYYSNPYLSLIATSWLGPGYRVTAQVNNVKPGGSPQEVHRDYHLGFQSTDSCLRYPRATHVASQFLTLQGAVAHTEMPLETGPTRLLPFSQNFEAGYVAYRSPEFKAHFQDNYVALPLAMGDGLFFNPALFHAAGENTSTDKNRLANLLQISSPFGKTMETINTIPIVESCWDHFLSLYEEQGMGDEVEVLVAAIGEGYPFPTNLDHNAPAQGDMTPPSEQTVLRKALQNKLCKDKVLNNLKKLRTASEA
jgi:ectoine hydroxylase-related dioxygenase (phytanoyl-CoA dioxygenase family)